MYIHHIALDCVHGSDFLVEQKSGLIDYLFLFIKSASTLVTGGIVYTITSPCVILIDSNTPYKYFPTGTKYIDDYLHFAVKDKASFVNELLFPLNTPVPILDDSSITSLLHNIQTEKGAGSKYITRILELLINLLMIKVGEQWDLGQKQNTEVPHYQDLLEIRNQILHSPQKLWRIEELAKEAHLSPAYFQVMYKKAFGITCITDVINAKIAQAKILLASTDLPVRQVAEELGYKEVYHFIRQFKKNTGLTPGVFRKKL